MTNGPILDFSWGDFNKYFPLASDFTNQGFVIGKLYAACGYPFGQKGLACNPVQVVNNDVLAVRVLGFLRNGMSGGPVLNEQGVAIGVNYAMTDGYCLVNSLQGFLGVFGL